MCAQHIVQLSSQVNGTAAKEKKSMLSFQMRQIFHFVIVRIVHEGSF